MKIRMRDARRSVFGNVRHDELCFPVLVCSGGVSRNGLEVEALMMVHSRCGDIIQERLECDCRAMGKLTTEKSRSGDSSIWACQYQDEMPENSM